MSGFEQHRPLDEQVDNELDAAVEKPSALEFDHMAEDLEGAVKAEGAEQVGEAIAQVQTGLARPQELLEWIDDIREFERAPKPVDDMHEAGFLQDFQADSVFAAGDMEGPPPYEHLDNNAGRPDSRSAQHSYDDDYDYLFPAARRKRAPGDDDEDGDGEAPAQADKDKSKKS